MASIAVSGQLLGHPTPANVMAGLHYLLGLRLLGHEVVYVEERGWLERCYEPGSSAATPTLDGGVAAQSPAETLRAILARLRADIPVVSIDSEGGLVEGLLWSQVRERLSKTDLLLEVGAPCMLEERWLAARRAFVDVDPVITRLSSFAANGYDAHFSYGVNVGQLDCASPAGAIDWLPTVPPVVPRFWRATRPPADAPMRAIATVAPAGRLEHGAVWLEGQDGGDCRMLRELPALVGGDFEVALPRGAGALRDAFVESGWKARALNEPGRSIAVYHGFVTGAQAELGTAREPNMLARNGWLGDRTACSLAAGRPAIVPDTGIGEWLATGSGILTFADADEAADAVESVRRHRERHLLAARTLADEVFHFALVLTHLLERSLPRRVDAVA